MTVRQEMRNTTKSKAKGNSIYSEGRGLAFESRRVHHHTSEVVLLSRTDLQLS